MSPPPMVIAHLLLLLLLSLAAGGAGGAAAAPAGSIHDLLRAHGLPAGLFPKEVESFSVDPATGLLEVHLDRPCYAKYDDVGLAYFDRVVRGNLSYGELRGMEGLSQEELFLWFPVKGIAVDDQSRGVILIDIGLAHKQLSLSLFEFPPECQPNAAAVTSLRTTIGGGEGPQDRIVEVQEQR